MGLMDKIGVFGQKGKVKEIDLLKQSLDLVMREPNNPRGHIKLAEIYKRRGEKDEAILEYLRAADIYAKNGQYAEALAIYKQIPRQDSSVDHVYLKIAEVYTKMGFIGDAFLQYKNLVNYYDKQGRKDKALEVMGLMADLDPRKMPKEKKVQIFKEALNFQEEEEGPIEVYEEEKKAAFFDLHAELEKGPMVEFKGVKEVATEEKIFGFDDILQEIKETFGPSRVYPTFNYNMGVAYQEMGSLDEAIEQFKIAVETNQNPFESTRLLGLCYKEKNMLDEAGQMLAKALQMEGAPADKKLEVQYALGLIYKEQGKKEEAFQLLKEIADHDVEIADKT